MRTVRIKLHTIDDLRHKAKNFAITEFFHSRSYHALDR